VASSFKFV
jgi:hypothetical protein